MATRLQLPERLDESGAFQFASLLWEHKASNHIILDFAPLRYALPFGTLVLMSELRSFLVTRKRTLESSDVKLANINPATDAVSYLAHVGFFKAVGFSKGNQPGQAKGSSTYLPITVLTLADLEDQRKLLKAARGDDKKPLGFFIQQESERLAYLITQKNQSKVIDPIAYCFREIIRNVYEHGATDKCAISGQRWNDKIEIAIVDRGRGIRHSLGEKYTFDTNLKYLENAVRPGISGKELTEDSDDAWANSGFGLYVLSELGKRLGSFTLCSGETSLKMHDGIAAEQNYAFHGTAVRLQIKRPKGANFWDYIQGIIDEGEALTAQQGSRVRASKSTRASSLLNINNATKTEASSEAISHSESALHQAISPQISSERDQQIEYLKLSCKYVLDQLDRATNAASHEILRRELRALDQKIEELKASDEVR